MKDGRTLGRAAIGEATAVAVVDQLLAAATADEPAPRVLTLEGAPYSGKTAALFELASRLGGNAFVVSIPEPQSEIPAFVTLLTQAVAPLARGAQLSLNAMYADLRDPSSVERVVRWFRSHLESELWILVDNAELLRGDGPRELLAMLVEQCVCVRWVFAGRSLQSLPLDRLRSRGIRITSIAGGAAEHGTAMRILERLDDNEREVLALLAPLRALESRLVYAILGEAGTLMLRRLQERHPALFDGERPPVMHRDVRCALIESLRERSPVVLEQVIECCGSALEACEYYEELLQLYLRMEARAEMLDLVSRRGLAVAADVNVDTLEAALALIRGEESPGILSLQAVLASRRGQSDAADALFTRALIDAPQPLSSQIAYAFGCDLLRRHRGECERIFERLLDESVPGGAHQSEIRSALAQAHVLNDRPSAALEQMKFALHVLPDSAAIQAAVKARAAYVYFYAAHELALAERFASDALAQALELRAYTIGVGAASLLYNIACERDRLQEALAALELLADCGIKLGNVAFQSYAVIAMLECQAEAGDRRAIAHATETLRAFEIDEASLVASESLASAQALQFSWTGEFERAYERLEPTAARAVGDDYRMLREAELAFYAAGARLSERAREHIGRCVEAMNLVSQTSHKRVRAAIFLALAQSALGELSAAEIVLASTTETSAPYPRLSAMREAAYLVHRARAGDLFETPLANAFARMRERGAGGFALAFAAFASMPPAATSTVGLRDLKPGTHHA